MNANLGVHRVTGIRAKRLCLPSGTNVLEIIATDDDGAEMTINLFTGNAVLNIAGLEAEEEVAA